MSRLNVFVVLVALCATALATTCMGDSIEQLRNETGNCRHVLLYPSGAVVLDEWDPTIALSIIASPNDRRTVFLADDINVADLVLYGVNLMTRTNSTLRVTKRFTAFECTITNVAVYVSGPSAHATVAFSSIYAQNGPVIIGDADSTVIFANNGFCDPTCIKLRAQLQADTLSLLQE